MYNLATVAGAARLELSGCTRIQDSWAATFADNIKKIRVDPMSRRIHLRIVDDPRGDVLQLLLAIASDKNVRPDWGHTTSLPNAVLRPLAAFQQDMPAYQLGFTDVRWDGGRLNYGEYGAFQIFSNLGVPTFAEHRVTLGYSRMRVHPPAVASEDHSSEGPSPTN